MVTTTIANAARGARRRVRRPRGANATPDSVPLLGLGGIGVVAGRQFCLEFGDGLPAYVRIEPVSGKQRIRPLPSCLALANSPQGRRPPRKQPPRSDELCGSHLSVVVVGRRPGGPLLENARDQLAVDSLDGELPAQGLITARMGSISGLDPGTREHLVVEHPQLREPLDGSFDQVRRVGGAGQVAADLVDRPLTRLQEARRGIEHDAGIRLGRVPFEPGLPGRDSIPSTAAGHGRLLGFLDPFDRE
jgi:hypothetical protein